MLLENHKGISSELKEIETLIERKINKQLRTKLERVKYANKPYPELMILDRTRNIFGYIVIRKLQSKDQLYGNLNDNHKRLQREIQISYSQLDRPVFYVYWQLDDKQQLELHFQTSEQIQDIFINKLDSDDNDAYIPHVNEMGEFQEMIKLINSKL